MASLRRGIQYGETQCQRVAIREALSETVATQWSHLEGGMNG